jgi:hypothetical protein
MIELVITDIQALKKTCERLGLEWKAEQKSFQWWGREPAKCVHAIKIPGARYELGVLQSATGKGYELQVDYYDSAVTAKIGHLGGLLKQGYAIEKAKMEAIKKGYSVREQRTAHNGIELRIAVQ